MSGPVYGTYVAVAVTNLQSLASDSSDPFAGWQSILVDNRSTLAIDYEVFVSCPMAATAPGGDGNAYVYAIPYVHNGSVFVPGGNPGNTTAPTQTEGTMNISEPNSMRRGCVMPYKVTSQPLQGSFSLCAALGMPLPPDAFSLVIRNNTGAAFSTGCVVGYRPITVV